MKSTCKEDIVFISHAHMQVCMFSGNFSVPHGRKVHLSLYLHAFKCECYFIVYILTKYQDERHKRDGCFLFPVDTQQYSLSFTCVFCVLIYHVECHSQHVFSLYDKLLTDTAFSIWCTKTKSGDKSSLSTDAQTDP